MQPRRALFCAGLVAVAVNAAAADDPQLTRRWVYLQLNLQVKENVAKAGEIMQRAARAGYNGVVLADYKLNILDRVPDFYFQHAAEFKRAAEELNLEIIPAVAPFGYSDGLLAHDPNLAEGLPVRDAHFLVRGNQPELSIGLTDMLPGGGFEQHKNHTVEGWSFQDGAGKFSFVDTQVKHGGASSLRFENPDSNARVSRVVKVQPWRQYHASVWVKTDNYSGGEVRMFAIGADGRILSHSYLGVKPTQDWTQHHVILNSLSNDELRFYCGTWGAARGKMWIDDAQLDETAFVNLLRRPGCPLSVTDAAGSTKFEEGRDYARLVDSKMGNVPYAGSYEVYHEPPAIKLLPDSRIKDGDELRVSFYHTVTIHNNQVTCCLGAPEVFEVLERQVRRVQDLFQPKTYYLSQDEIRVANWCESCNREGRSAAQLLAENMQKCVATIRTVNPHSKLCVWSDMFDPHHNARNDFYLVNGDLTGSWEGLPRDMVVVNWNHGKAAESLKFFAGRGHEQVLSGFYDHDPKRIVAWLKQGGSLEGIKGAMYTTWRNDFSELETFAEAAWGGMAN